MNSQSEKQSSKLQSFETKHKEQINELNRQEQERIIAIQREQISSRDKIIAEQRRQLLQHAKSNSVQPVPQIETTNEASERTKVKTKQYTLPYVKDHYYNKEAYMYRKDSPASKAGSRLQTPLQSIDKKQQGLKTKRIMDNLSTPILPKVNPLTRVPPQKLIDSKSMVALSYFSANRNLNKFVYDWKGGGYKFLEDRKNIPLVLPSERELQYLSKQNLDKSFFTTTSRSTSAKRVIKPNLLLPGRVHESPYVKGFISKDNQRKLRLQQLNKKMKKVLLKK